MSAYIVSDNNVKLVAIASLLDWTKAIPTLPSAADVQEKARDKSSIHVDIIDGEYAVTVIGSARPDYDDDYFNNITDAESSANEILRDIKSMPNHDVYLCVGGVLQ